MKKEKEEKEVWKEEDITEEGDKIYEQKEEKREEE